jgi:hypothetical protein
MRHCIGTARIVYSKVIVHRHSVLVSLLVTKCSGLNSASLCNCMELHLLLRHALSSASIPR